jgi:hypothetical protein
MEDSLAVLLSMAGATEHLPALREAGATLESLLASLEEGRPKLLSTLKNLGVGSLSARQAIANALAKFVRSGGFTDVQSSAAAASTDPGPAPPGSITVNVRCAGALGGDKCALPCPTLSPLAHACCRALPDHHPLVRAAARTLSCAAARAAAHACSCPLNGKFRDMRVHTAERHTVRELFEELKAARGYALDWQSVRVSVMGQVLDPGEAAARRLTDGTTIMLFGPNRGG